MEAEEASTYPPTVPSSDDRDDEEEEEEEEEEAILDPLKKEAEEGEAEGGKKAGEVKAIGTSESNNGLDTAWIWPIRRS
jgi:hypothetical protein